MRSRPDLARGVATLLIVCTSLYVAPTARAVGGAAPTQQEIERAVETVKKDPNLAAERTVKTPKWIGSDDEEKPKTRRHLPDWLSWIPNLFSWIGQASQMLVWVLIAALVGLLVLFIARLVRDTRLSPKGSRFVAPTHVQDLDIRPESLPPDIGAAARALWDGGEHRAALALLYRGLLSRLAHVHEVAIRDSSTEGDCLTLAARKLDPARIAYITQLVRTWQRFTYGGQQIDDAAVHELCAGFAANLDPPTENAATGDGRFAGASA